jgi:alanine racemase
MQDQVGPTAPAALHVDTGMARLGLTLAEAAKAAADQSVAPILVMSHLACADLPAHPLNETQAERFRQVRSLFPQVPGSLSASSGIFLGPAWHHDWARAGAALWGVNPTPDDPNPMAQVVRLKGKIVQLRDIDGGDTVGYGAAYRARRASRLAVVAVGYADGLLRSLEGRGIAHVGESAVPMVGRVSMDLVTFDVTHIPPHAVAPGDFIDLIGPHFSVDQLAAAAQTSAYEILTGLGSRFHRVYTGEPA